MSTQVYVLPGYSDWVKADKIMRASGSSTLIISPDTKVLVDTLGPWESDRLELFLREHSLVPDDIDIVVGTHGHADHIGNLNMFKNCQKHVVGWSVYHKDQYDIHPFECDVPMELDSNIQVIGTPGHTSSCVSVIVKNVETLGTVVITGDLFEKKEDLEDESIWLYAGSDNPDQQRSSRSKVLAIADYIVPGHGPMFKVEKNKA